MKRKADTVEYVLKCDSVIRKCAACRKTIKNEPFAIKKQYTGGRNLFMQTRCWRCWHSAEVTLLFLQKYPDVFKRVKQGPWHYLSLWSEQFHFPSDDGEHEPDW